MRRRSKRYKEILKLTPKDKKINTKEILDLIRKILMLDLTSQLMFH